MSAKHLSNSEYTKRARKLRTYGFALNYKANSAVYSVGNYKGAITRAWNRAKFYAVNSEKNRIEFKRFKSPTEKAKYARFVAPEQIAPGGIWVQRPKGVEKGKWKYKLQKDGTVSITTSDKRKVNDVILRLDVTALAEDSRAEFERILKGRKRPKQILLTVNGFDAGQSHENLEAFNRYIETELIPDLERAQFDFDKWGDQIFGMRLVYSGKGQKKSGDEGKTFDFSTGSIFDADSKKVYGKRKFRDREKHTVKKGKRKGT